MREELAALKEDKVALREGLGSTGVWIPSASRKPNNAPTGSAIARAHKKSPPLSKDVGKSSRISSTDTVQGGGGGASVITSFTLSPTASNSLSSKDAEVSLSPYSRVNSLLGSLGPHSRVQSVVEANNSFSNLPPLDLRPQKGTPPKVVVSLVQIPPPSSSSSGSGGGAAANFKPRDLYSREISMEASAGIGYSNKGTEKWVMRAEQGGRIIVKGV